MTARLLHVKSEIGKELDSLADMVSFGVAPAILAYFLIVRELPGGDFLHFATWTLGQQITAVMPVVIAPFSAYRLAKFNLDVRQATSFIGMPTPANALFGYAWFRKLLYSGTLYDLVRKAGGIGKQCPYPVYSFDQ